MKTEERKYIFHFEICIGCTGDKEIVVHSWKTLLALTLLPPGLGVIMVNMVSQNSIQLI